MKNLKMFVSDLKSIKADRYEKKVYYLLTDGDRRSKDYKNVTKRLDILTKEYGKNSAEVNLFFDADLEKLKELL